MTDTDGGPAIPTAGGWEKGLSLRDFFAAHALAAIAADFGDTCDGYREAVSRRAYMLADAMIAARASK